MQIDSSFPLIQRKILKSVNFWALNSFPTFKQRLGGKRKEKEHKTPLQLPILKATQFKLNKI